MSFPNHPYIPNSNPQVKDAMLMAVRAKEIGDFYADIPASLRLQTPLDLPEPLPSEAALVRHVRSLLAQNQTCAEYPSFLGAGCYRHHVPALCDEINARSEFLTAYAGRAYTDHGKFQALFEYASMMAELLNMDVVSGPMYDGNQAAATALRMAARITGRHRALIIGTISRDRLSKFRDYCQPDLRLELLSYDPVSGQMDLASLQEALNQRPAAVYFENPNTLGFLETQSERIVQLAHDHGALAVVYVNPISLGVLAPPADYGADIACGDIQPLGIHIQYGGGHGGYALYLFASEEARNAAVEAISEMRAVEPFTK